MIHENVIFTCYDGQNEREQHRGETIYETSESSHQPFLVLWFHYITKHHVYERDNKSCSCT